MVKDEIEWQREANKKSQKDVKEYFTNLKGVEITLKEFKGSLMGQFSNGCILLISIDFD